MILAKRVEILANIDVGERFGTDLIDRSDDFGITALHIACRSGRPETVNLLLDAGAKIAVKAQFGDTLLHCCAGFEEGKGLWKQSPSKRTLDAAGVLRSDGNRPPLSMDFRQLLNEGFRMFDPISASNKDTYTTRVRDIVETLIEHGADVGAPNNNQLYPIDLAIDAGCEAMVEVLLPHMEAVYAKE